MSKPLKKTLLISASLLMFLSVGTGINNVNASKRHVKTSKMVKLHKRSKKQQIHKEHKYFYASAHDVNSPEWYYKYSPAIDDYVDDNTLKLKGFNGKFYTNRAKSFVDGFDDINDHDTIKMRHTLKKRHINPTAYKEGWIIGDNDDNISSGREYHKGLFTDSLFYYHLYQHGPTRKQHNNWVKIERKYMSPTKREANSPKWFEAHYNKANNYYNKITVNKIDNVTPINHKSYFQTPNGKSYAIGSSSNDTNDKIPSIQSLRRHHIDPYSFKEGYIINEVEENSSTYTLTKNMFTKAISCYNHNKPYVS